MGLRKRILIGYGIALSLTAVVIGWAVIHLARLGQASDAILRENYRSILAAENMINALERQDSAVLLVILGFDKEGLEQFRENENQFLQWLGRGKDNITIEGEAEILQRIERAYSDYLARFSNLRGLAAEERATAGTFYHETVLPPFTDAREACAQLREINEETMFAASRRAEGLAQRAFSSTLAVGAAAVGVGLIFSLLLSKRLVQPLERMLKATERLAGGDYTAHVEAAESEELGRLAASFNSMAKQLGMYHRMNVERIVAEKRKSEAVLRSIEDGVVVTDAEFRITDINPLAARILKVDPEHAKEKHFLEVVKSDRLFALIKQAAESGRPPAIEEGKDVLSLGDGERARHFLFDVAPVLSEGGGMIGVVLLLRDVTRLKELDRLKSEFVMTASHELKTPLQSLGMSIALLEEGAADQFNERQRELLATAQEELKRLKALISDLLDLSKIEAGRVEMELESAAPGPLIDQALSVLHEQARQQQVELVATAPGGLPNVWADPNKITWVLTNLISNALRYVDRHGHIRVAAERVGQRVHLSVSDDGEGIPPEYQSRIFDKFVQVKSAKSVGGSGLGLAICKEIVRAHKGTIWVDSTPGEGATFTFTLPLADQQEESPDGSKANPHRR
ncbi:MAG TPA: ATP-binding protein [Phycisphaerae bacterium]|nr:ATP-binding protein [Phycisphaerae bacterium]